MQVDHNGPKDALRALRKRLFKSTEPKVQLLSLSVRNVKRCAAVADVRCWQLLDMLVKNCGSPLYNLVADKDFLGDLGKLIRDRKTNGTVRDKALDLLQCWRAGLLHEPAGKHIEETNIKLKRDGTAPGALAQAGHSHVFAADQASNSRRATCLPCRQLSATRHDSRRQRRAYAAHRGMPRLLLLTAR